MYTCRSTRLLIKENCINFVSQHSKKWAFNSTTYCYCIWWSHLSGFSSVYVCTLQDIVYFANCQFLPFTVVTLGFSLCAQTKQYSKCFSNVTLVWWTIAYPLYVVLLTPQMFLSVTYGICTPHWLRSSTLLCMMLCCLSVIVWLCMFSMEHCLPDATHLRIRLLCYDILCMVACTSHSSNSVYICNCMSCAYSNSFLSSGSHWDCVYSGCFSVNMLKFITFPHTCTLPPPNRACSAGYGDVPVPQWHVLRRPVTIYLLFRDRSKITSNVSRTHRGYFALHRAPDCHNIPCGIAPMYKQVHTWPHPMQYAWIVHA